MFLCLTGKRCCSYIPAETLVIFQNPSNMARRIEHFVAKEIKLNVKLFLFGLLMVVCYTGAYYFIHKPVKRDSSLQLSPINPLKIDSPVEMKSSIGSDSLFTEEALSQVKGDFLNTLVGYSIAASSSSRAREIQAPDDFGASKYDKTVNYAHQLENLHEFRKQSFDQDWKNQFGYGILIVLLSMLARYVWMTMSSVVRWVEKASNEPVDEN